MSNSQDFRELKRKDPRSTLSSPASLLTRIRTEPGCGQEVLCGQYPPAWDLSNPHLQELSPCHSPAAPRTRWLLVHLRTSQHKRAHVHSPGDHPRLAPLCRVNQLRILPPQPAVLSTLANSTAEPLLFISNSLFHHGACPPGRTIYLDLF